MYESRSCFLFTIFVTCLLKLSASAPQVYHSADFYSSHHPYYGYDSQQASYYASGSPVVPENNTYHPSSVSQTSANAVHPHGYYPSGVLPLVQQNMQPVVTPFPSSPPFQQTGYAAPTHAFPPHHPLPPPAHQQNLFYSPPISGIAPSPPTPYSSSVPNDGHSSSMSQAVGAALPSAPFHQTSGVSQPLYPSAHHQATSPQLTYSVVPPFGGYPGFQGPVPTSYPTANDAFNYHMPQNVASYPAFPSMHHHPFYYQVPDSQASVTKTSTKKETPTTSRPKTTTPTPKPLEFELSIEDFFYLSQLHQLFNKSKDKQSIDISSPTGMKSVKKTGEDKDESPVFYGGVFDLEELAKIDNMKDLMDVFKKIEPKTQVSRKDPEFDASFDKSDETQVEDEGGQQERSKRRKGSPDVTSHTRSHNRPRKVKQKKKIRRKGSDRLDDGTDEEQEDTRQEEEEEEGTDEAEESGDDEKIGIGSTPSTSQLSGRGKKQRVTSTTTTTTTTPLPPLAVYPNPYLYSMQSYAYPHLQQQYMQQLQAMSGHFQSLNTPGKEVSKFPDEDDLPLASPNENRNVINVNIADPKQTHKVPDNLNDDVAQETGSRSHGLRFPLRRGSFNSMAHSLTKKALNSILYRIFPTMKHLNVKGVAARGCRDVQSIGSLDSIIMPLGLAVTLHPLLLPLVPFLLLALGSIKAIESATCFVSEYFT